jgi:hypothetical protein
MEQFQQCPQMQSLCPPTWLEWHQLEPALLNKEMGSNFDKVRFSSKTKPDHQTVLCSKVKDLFGEGHEAAGWQVAGPIVSLFVDFVMDNTLSF